MFLFLWKVCCFCGFNYRFPPPEAALFPAASIICSCQTRRSSALSSLPSRLSEGIRCLSAAPAVVERITKTCWGRTHCHVFLIPKHHSPPGCTVVVHYLRAHRQTRVLPGLVRCDALVFYHNCLPMSESQGVLHFHWFLSSPLGGYNHPLKKQK